MSKAYTKKELQGYLNKDIRLHYTWNGSKNAVTCTLKKAHYIVEATKLDSNQIIKTKYKNIAKIELIDEIENIY